MVLEVNQPRPLSVFNSSFSIYLSFMELLEFQDLKIPYFCLIDFISLTQSDDGEAEFLGELVSGSQNCSSVWSRISQ